MSFSEDHPGHEIVTKEQAKNWIVEQIKQLAKVRLGCLVVLPDKRETVEFRKMAYEKFLKLHGGVLGMLAVLCRCRRLDKEAYESLRAKAMDLLGPSLIIGRYDWFSHMESWELTEEQARNWVLEQLECLRGVRANCNVYFPKDKVRTKKHQEDANRCFMVKQGGVLGMLVALQRCRKLSDVAHNKLREETVALQNPTVVGGVYAGF